MRIVSAQNMQRSAALLVILLSYTNFNQLGMMGTSVLYSSGDNGVAGIGDQCLNSDGLSFLFLLTLLVLIGYFRGSLWIRNDI